MTKRQTYGTSWWGKRFLASLDGLGWADRVERGRTYASQGRVRGLAIKAGRVTAKVQGSPADPYTVSVEFTPLGPADWNRVTRGLAEQPELVAGLLSGKLPPELEGVLESVGGGLFPHGDDDLRTSCSCPDWANPCKHVAAVFYKIAGTLDADPLLLVELRGRDREALISELTERWRRDGGASPEPRTDPFWTAGPAAKELGLRFDPVPEPGALLEDLKLPPELTGEHAVLARLKRYYERIHARAAELVIRCGGE